MRHFIQKPTHTLLSVLLAAALFLPALSGGATNSDRQRAFDTLKSATSPTVQQLPRGDREIMMAKILIDRGDTRGAIAVLDEEHTAGNPLAGIIRAEAFRLQSVQAANRAGNYARSVSGDINKLKNARLSAGLDEAEQRLQAFIVADRNAVAEAHAEAERAKAEAAAVARRARAEAAAKVRQEKAEAAAKAQQARAEAAAKAAAERQSLVASIHNAIDSWRTDWESLNADAYLAHYHPQFSNYKYSNLEAWSAYKRRVNGNKSYIHIAVSDIRIRRGPEQIGGGEGVYVSFRQQYESSNFTANGTKYIYLVRETSSMPWRIIFEGDSAAGFKPQPLLQPVKAPSKASPAAQEQAAPTSKNQEPGSHSDKQAEEPVTLADIANRKRWVINIGAFESWAGAEQMASDIRADTEYNPHVATVFINGQPQVHRVQLGPYDNRTQAINSMIATCQDLGLLDCWIEQKH